MEEEIWKIIKLDSDGYSNTRYEISILGRVRSFNKVSNGNILKGSMAEGYRVLKLKLFKEREKHKEEEFNHLKQEISKLYERRRELTRLKAYPPKIDRVTERIENKEKNLSKRLHTDFKRRTINRTLLFHRLVAKYFLPEPQSDQIIVSHLDYNKLNNEVSNLEWMTPEANKEHQHKSPYVIAEKKERKFKSKYKRQHSKGWKLDSTKVMHIKLLLKKGSPVRKIAKRFKVSETQIRRIKSGENWSSVKISQ